MQPVTTRRVALTGMGIVSPCGIGIDRFWEAMLAGRSGIGRITQFDASGLDTQIAGEIAEFDPLDFLDRKDARRMGRFQHLAMAAADLAIRDAAVVLGPGESERAAVIIGSSVGGLLAAERGQDDMLARGPGAVGPFFILQVLPNLLPAYVAIRWGFRGANLSMNSACATGAHAIGEAFRLIQQDHADVALAGGAEAPLCAMAVIGFNNLRALSRRNDAPAEASRPFDAARDGFVMAEGAGVLVLEDWGRAVRRGARIYGELVGYGVSADAHHITAPAPGHEGGQRCMRLALRDAGLEPADIGYINAHAPGTQVGDPLEAEAIRAVFGERAARLPVSSTKSMTGHMLGAAGAVELAVTSLAALHGCAPATVNLGNPEPAVGVDFVRGGARPISAEHAMNNAFGFGGTNAALIVRRGE